MWKGEAPRPTRTRIDEEAGFQTSSGVNRRCRVAGL
jgi:hypothetical protein